MQLEFRSEYWDDREARAAFKTFILEIHGLDFTAWETAGYWDERYTPFSFFDGGRVVASMCVYLLDAVVDGTATKLVQISGVGTAPELRRRGLNRELTARGLDWAAARSPSGVFLFADEDAVPFYRRCGFDAIEEYTETLEPIDRKGSAVPEGRGLRRLDPDLPEERDRIYELARKRAPLSSRFSVQNAELVMFHCLYGLRDGIFEIPDRECIVLASRANGVLRIHDLLAEEIPTWNELAPFLLHPRERLIEFCFFTDRLDLEGTRLRPLQGNHPFVRPGFPITDPVFPATARA